MQLSFKNKFVFLCMPKCASTSIEHVLKEYSDLDMHNPPALKHINVKSFNKYVLPLVHDKLGKKRKLESFCLMRDPVDWAFSWYNYRARPSINNPNHPMYNRYTGEISFDQFVDEMMMEESPLRARIGNQSNFFLIKDDIVGVDKIFKLSSMDKLEDFLSNKLKTDIKIPKRNTSKKKESIINEETVLKLRKHFKKDYDFYENKAI